jgi:hypothetical protein
MKLWAGRELVCVRGSRKRRCDKIISHPPSTLSVLSERDMIGRLGSLRDFDTCRTNMRSRPRWVQGLQTSLLVTRNSEGERKALAKQTVERLSTSMTTCV